MKEVDKYGRLLSQGHVSQNRVVKSSRMTVILNYSNPP